MPKRPCPGTAATRELGSSAAAAGADLASAERPLVVVIAGPTGVGKSKVGAELCRPANAGRLLARVAPASATPAAAVGHIVSADSVQAYRGVQVGANKPTAEERADCPHHLIDVVGSDAAAYNAADWMRDATYAVGELYGEGMRPGGHYDASEGEDEHEDSEVLASRRRRQEDIGRGISDVAGDAPVVPVVVGGTMMYLQWLVHGRPDASRPTEEALSKAKVDVASFQAMDGIGGEEERKEDDEQATGEAEDKAKSPGWDAAVAHARSLGLPFRERVSTLCGKDWYRLRRILEVAYTLGEEATESQLEAVYSGERYGGLGTRGYDVRCFFLCPSDRLKHAEVIDRRCEDMIMRGLLAETAELSLAGELPDNGQPARAIGYRQTLDYLRRSNATAQDEDSFNEFMDKFTTATRQYAKKQSSWFRKDSEFMFIPISLSKPSRERVQEATETIMKMCALSRTEFDAELYSECPNVNTLEGGKVKKGKKEVSYEGLSLSARTKLENERQGKSMKFYRGDKRYQLVADTPELKAAMAEADISTQKIQNIKDMQFINNM